MTQRRFDDGRFAPGLMAGVRYYFFQTGSRRLVHQMTRRARSTWSAAVRWRPDLSPVNAPPFGGGGQFLWRRSEEPAEVEGADGGVHAARDDGIAAVADAGRAEVAFAEAEHDEDRAAIR